jgi:hypothetical protein
MNKIINGKQWRTFEVGQYVIPTQKLLDKKSKSRTFNSGQIIAYKKSYGQYIVKSDAGIWSYIASELQLAEVVNIDCGCTIDGRPIIGEILCPVPSLPNGYER